LTFEPKYGDLPPPCSLLLERLQMKGDEVVFLDDIGSNLSAARRAGIATIKAKSIEKKPCRCNL
jgi:methionine salvage enolase-phosphatase E1